MSQWYRVPSTPAIKSPENDFDLNWLILDNVSELRKLEPTSRSTVTVMGAVQRNDGGYGSWYYDALDNSSSDNGVSVIVTARGRRWKTVPKPILTLDSVANLRSLSNFKETVVTRYGANNNDNGGGVWYYDALDTTTPDNIGTVIVASDGKRWKRIYNGAIRPEWFGAKFDGATDDTTAIQAAINAAQNVELPIGTAIISNSLVLITGSNITGAGKLTTIMCKSGVSFENAIFADNKSNINLQNFTVDANGLAREVALNSVLATTCIRVQNSTNITILNVLLQNALGATTYPGVGVSVGACVRVTITGCFAQNCGKAGKAADGFYTNGDQIIINGCTALNCFDTGFVLEGCNYSGINGCTADGCASGAAITNFVVAQKTGNYINGLTVNNWNAAVTGGIQLGPLGASTGDLLNTRVSGVTITRISGTGPAIYVRSTSTAGRNRRVKISDVQVNGASTQGILVEKADDIMIDNVQVFDTPSAGIQFETGCTNVVVNNAVIRPGVGGSFGIRATAVAGFSAKNLVIVGSGASMTQAVYLFGTCSGTLEVSGDFQNASVSPVGSDTATINVSSGFGGSTGGSKFGAALDVNFYREAANIMVSDNNIKAAAFRVGVNQVIQARETGYTAGTGTANKGAFATSTATVTDCAQRIKALEDTLRTHGLIN